MKLLTLFTLLSLMINCKTKSTQNKVKNNQKNLERVWMLTEFSGFDKQFLITSKAVLNLTNSEYAIAKMGCNTLSFHYKITPSEIILSKGVSTLMVCADMKLEDAFSKVILDYKKYKVEGHILTLLNSQNEKMIFVAQDWD
jgi:heat shock protein HslJ